MTTTFGVTATTRNRPIAVVAPMCHHPLTKAVDTTTHRPCNEPGPDPVALLPTAETTTTALKDLTTPVRIGAPSSSTVRDPTGETPAQTGTRIVPTLMTSPFRNSVPHTVPSTSDLWTQGASMSGAVTHGPSVLGAVAKRDAGLGAAGIGISSLSFPYLEKTLARSCSDDGVISHESYQLHSRSTRDRRSATVPGRPFYSDRTSGDFADGVAASLKGCMLVSGITKDQLSDAILKEATFSPSSPSGFPPLALSLEQKDLSKAVDECNFYYGSMTNTEAKSRLHRCSVGTFLLRDSSDPRFRYSLSVKTTRGTTSIRIVGTSTGHFRLDSDPHQESRMPAFQWILSLAEHYFLSASKPSSEKGKHRGHCVLLESSGRYDTPMVLRRPLELSPAPLAHLCRRAINNLVPSAEDRRKLIDSIAGEVDAQRRESIHEYMAGYPFRV